jgi:cytochrome c biogenesis protein CcdA
LEPSLPNPNGWTIKACPLYLAFRRFTDGLFRDLLLGAASAPTYLIALLAGLISFFLPWELPLVPAYVGYLSGHAFEGVRGASA